MKVGVPTEIKTDEYRVALTPIGARELAEHGHDVIVQKGAGEGSAISDADYEAQGVTIVPSAEDVWGEAEMVLKVKEPQIARGRDAPGRDDALHLPPPGAGAGAHEGPVRHGCDLHRVRDGRGRPGPACRCWRRCRRSRARSRPRRAPSCSKSRWAGAASSSAACPGVAAANVMIIGGGAVGMNAAFIAIGMEADVFVYDTSIDKLRELDVIFGGRASTVFSSTLSIEERLPDMDLVIGGVLVHGARAPHVITREQLGLMKKSAVLVDVAIDQGGCFETSKPTTHSDPTYEVDGIIHYCVANMPGAVPITSTYALTNATLPYTLALADDGVVGAVGRIPGLKPGINVAQARSRIRRSPRASGMDCTPPEEVLDFEMPQNGSRDGAGEDAARAMPGKSLEPKRETEKRSRTWASTQSSTRQPARRRRTIGDLRLRARGGDGGGE